MFRSIGIVVKPTDARLAATLGALLDLLAAHGRGVLLDESTTAGLPVDASISRASRDTLKTQCDLVIVIGGDGTFLSAARDLASESLNLLGINLGRLGFLTDVSAEDMITTLERVLAGEIVREQRYLLSARVFRGTQVLNNAIALNDVVLHKWNIARLIEFTTHIDGRLVNSQRSDGLIVATPTGSTAYALSGGGPLIHPQLDAMVLVPICPHTLSARPLVVGGQSRVEIALPDAGGEDAHITCDGQTTVALKPGDRLEIVRHEQPLNLVHPADYDYYGTLRAKLNWGQ